MSDILHVHCPVCGAYFDLEQAWQSEDGRRFVGVLTSLPPIVVRPLYGYLKLFKPHQQALRWSTLLKIVMELKPLISDAQITRNGLTYAVSPRQWADAMTYLVDNQPASLVLPLKKNAYLIQMLANQAEQKLVKSEQQHEQSLSTGRAKYSGTFTNVNDVVKPKKGAKPPANFKENLNI